MQTHGLDQKTPTTTLKWVTNGWKVLWIDLPISSLTRYSLIPVPNENCARWTLVSKSY